MENLVIALKPAFKAINPEVQIRLNQNEGVLVKNPVTVADYTEVVVMVSANGKWKKEIYFNDGKNWWIKEFRMCGKEEVATGYQSKNSKWTRVWICLLKKAYQTSYTDSNGNFSKSEHKIFGNEVRQTYNENNEGWWRTEFVKENDEDIVEKSHTKKRYKEKILLKNYKH